jgi:hypothetical protein
VTYTFSNSTTADATQVNQNFTDVLDGITDGTKDLTIGLLTANGAASFNADVTLGNATGDDITFTGRVASDIDPKTGATSDLGDATQTWRALYLDNTSTDGGAIYFDGGSTEYIRSSADGATLQISGFTAWDFPGGEATAASAGLLTSYVPVILSSVHSVSSANYTVLDSDGYATILVTTGASDRTITLPTAADNTGRTLTSKKVDSGVGDVIVEGEGSETIDGALNNHIISQYSSLKLVCDGTGWHILEAPKDFVPSGVGTTAVSEGAYVQIAAITLEPGEWDLQALGYWNGTGTGTSIIGAISDTTASNSGTTAGYDNQTSNVDANNVGQISVQRRIKITVADTYYFNIRVNGTTLTGNILGHIAGRRVN